MKMKSGSQLKGRQVEAPHGKRSLNQPDVLPVRMRGKAEAPTQGRTRNHPNVAPVPKAEIGKALPNSFYANSRTPVHKKFDTKGKHD
jgi:hypothetical protein